MFSGIVKASCSVLNVERLEGMTRFCVQLTPELAADLLVGASVAIDGVCLTATKIENNRVCFDAMEETLTRTTLSTIENGHYVHVERSLRLGDEIGGHILSGHVFGTGRVEQIEISPNNHIITINVPSDWTKYILTKGYIAVDGASLTVVNVSNNGFTVHLIPETLRMTHLAQKRVGDRVNIEIDTQTQAVITTVERYLKLQTSNLP